MDPNQNQAPNPQDTTPRVPGQDGQQIQTAVLGQTQPINAPPTTEPGPPPDYIREGFIAKEQLSTDYGLPTTAENQAVAQSGTPKGEQPKTTPPAKPRFDKKKVIASFLGLALIVGGISAGVFLVGQRQEIREEAGTGSTCFGTPILYKPAPYEYSVGATSSPGDDDWVLFPIKQGCGKFAMENTFGPLDEVFPNVYITRPNSATQYGFTFNRITHIDGHNDADIQSGQPSLTEPQLEGFHAAGKDSQTIDNCDENARQVVFDFTGQDPIAKRPVAKPNGWRAARTGYYQFDLTPRFKCDGTLNQGSLGAGFIRVTSGGGQCLPVDEPAGPSPSNGAANVSRTPDFSWSLPRPGNGTFYSNVYLWDCASRSDSCIVGGSFSPTSSSPVLSAAFPTFQKAQGGGFGGGTLPPLSCNKKYYWQVTPGTACNNTHITQVAWSFTTTSNCATPTTTPTPTPTPTSTPVVSASCLAIKIFDTNWNQITGSQLSSLKPGDKIRPTVAGSATSGSFDKARFKINGIVRPEVTGKRPGTEEFFDEYTLPMATTNFTINAEVHHSTLGWF